jgi:hypothetical protein
VDRPAKLTPRQLDYLVGGLVLAGYVVGQLLLLQGPHPFDPARYFETAVEFPNVAVDYWTLRIGLIAPVRVAVLLFGPSEAALYAVPLAAGLLLTGSVYGTMLVLFRERVPAVAAALVTGLNPSFLLNSGYIFPDTLATATFTAGVFCLVLGRPRSDDDPEGWLPTLFVLGAGFLFGWSYLVREFSPILLLAVLAAVVLLRFPARRVLLLAGAVAATACLEPAYGAVRYGDPFIHLRTLLRRGDQPLTARRGRLVEQINEQIENPLDAVLVFPRLLLTWNSGWVLVVLILVFAAGLFQFRDRRLWLLASWFFSFWAVMAAFGYWRLSSGDLIVNVTNIRYWYPIFPPLIMGAFGSLCLLLAALAPRGVRLLYVVVPVLAAAALVPGSVEFSSCAAKNVWRNDPAERWNDLQSWFGTAEAQRYNRIRTDKLTNRLLPAYRRTTFGDPLWHGTVRILNRRGAQLAPDDPEGSLILVHKDRFTVPNAQERLNELDREWSPIFVSDDERMVLLAYDSAAIGAAGEAERSWANLARDRSAVQPGDCGLSPYEPVD